MADHAQQPGLIYAYILDGKGGGRALSWQDMEARSAELARPWFHLDLTDPRAQGWLRDRGGLDAAIVDALLDEDTRPRSVLHEDGVLVNNADWLCKLNLVEFLRDEAKYDSLNELVAQIDRDCARALTGEHRGVRYLLASADAIDFTPVPV